MVHIIYYTEESMKIIADAPSCIVTLRNVDDGYHTYTRLPTVEILSLFSLMKSQVETELAFESRTGTCPDGVE